MITFKIMFSFQALEFVFIGSKSVWSYFSHACDYILKTDNQAVHQEPLSPKGRLRTCCYRWVLPHISKEGMTGWAQESMEPNTLMVRAWSRVLPQLRRFCCCLPAAIGQRSQEHWPRIQTLQESQGEALHHRAAEGGGCRWTRGCCLVASHSYQSTFRNTFSCWKSATRDLGLCRGCWIWNNLYSKTTDHPASLSGQV